MSGDARGQSETIGVALLIGVVVTVVGIASVTIFAGMDTTERPTVDIQADANSTHVTITHGGGDEVALADLRVILDGNTRTQFTPDSANVTGSSGDFGFGDSLVRDHSIGGPTMNILVVHTPTNTVLAEQRVDLRSSSGSKPQAQFSVSRTSPSVGQTVTFDGSSTTDPDGDRLSFAWDFDGDGNDDTTGRTATHSYDSAGTYTATLTVVDDTGERASASKTISVSSGDTSAPAISAFSVTNPSGQEVTVSFDADEQLAGIDVAISNTESGTLTRSEFSETVSSGTYTYEATYSGSSDGVYDATLNSATDSAGNDGSTGQSDSVTVDSVAPSISGTSLVDATDGNGVVTDGDSVTVSVSVSDATSGVDTVTADVSAFDAGTVPLTDGNGDGTYERTVTVGAAASEGLQTATVSATDSAGNEASTETDDTVEVDTTQPAITATSLTADSGEPVTTGDSVTVTATVTDDGSGVDSVTASATAFDAGTVTLTDGDGDGTYEGTFTVGENPTDGPQTVTVTAADTAGNDVSATTSDSVEVDATAPQITTFTVRDTSEVGFFYYLEEFQIEWTVSDANLATVDVTVSRDGTVQDSYSGADDDTQYQNFRVFSFSGREHTIRIVATDTAGNRACQRVVTTADGNDPTNYETC